MSFENCEGKSGVLTREEKKKNSGRGKKRGRTNPRSEFMSSVVDGMVFLKTDSEFVDILRIPNFTSIGTGYTRARKEHGESQQKVIKDAPQEKKELTTVWRPQTCTRKKEK